MRDKIPVERDSVPVTISNRKARKERLLEFEALADFVNLGDTLDDVRTFREKWPDFFPEEKTEWIYRNAEFWMTFSNLPDKRPDNYREIFRRVLPAADSPMTIEAWADMAKDLRGKLRSCRPPLLWYRALLRAVWRREDPDGSCLRELLGFDADYIPFPGEEDTELEPLSLFMWKEHPEEKPQPITINGITYRIRQKETETIAGLPYGTPVVDGNTGIITWSFGCTFQRDVYDLMQDRWRAMVCPECGTYFVADKTAQKFCSPKCWAKRKREQALDYYNRKGKHARQKAKSLRAKPQRRITGVEQGNAGARGLQGLHRRSQRRRAGTTARIAR
jgi:hypothetical protein